MPAHKKGKARAERRERAAAKDRDAVEQSEVSTAAQELGPSKGTQQPGPSSQVGQAEPRNATQRGVTGVEGEEDTGQITNVGESGPDEPVLPTLTEEQLGETETGLTRQENAAAEEHEEGEAVPTDIESTGDDHAGTSKRLEQSCHGNVNHDRPPLEVQKKRRGWE